MAANDAPTVARDRLVFAGIGAGAGIAAWLLVEELGDIIANDRLYLFAMALAGVFFASLLAMFGPLRIAVAALRAAGLALIVAGLLVWASLRFDDLDDFFYAPWPVLAAFGICVIGVPFLIAGALPGKGMRDYPTLFSQAWSILVRYGAAWLFVGVVWALVYLSDALFGLVGLSVIRDLLDIVFVPYLLTGIALGLALAVVEEWSDYVSPFLVLRLLRVLVPVVILVILVFLLALPFQGLSGVFGDFSAAGILLGMAVGAATLVTTALDQSDTEAVDLAVMRWATRALALVVPLLAVLGAWAIWLRVAQYGWTPPRLAAAAGAAVVVGYGGLYAVAALRDGWMARIRAANVTMALVVMGLAALWLTPILNAERISSASQVARFKAGTVSVADLDLWQLRENWGRAGDAALAGLTELAAADGQDALRTRLQHLADADYEHEFNAASAGAGTADLTAELAGLLVVRPAGNEAVVQAIAAGSYPEELRSWIAACRRVTAAGKPGCVLVVGEFLLHQAGPEALLFHRQSVDSFRYEAFSLGADGVMARPYPVLLGGAGIQAGDADRMLELLEAGKFSIAPAEINALSIDGRQIMISP